MLLIRKCFTRIMQSCIVCCALYQVPPPYHVVLDWEPLPKCRESLGSSVDMQRTKAQLLCRSFPSLNNAPSNHFLMNDRCQEKNLNPLCPLLWRLYAKLKSLIRSVTHLSLVDIQNEICGKYHLFAQYQKGNLLSKEKPSHPKNTLDIFGFCRRKINGWWK